MRRRIKSGFGSDGDAESSTVALRELRTAISSRNAATHACTHACTHVSLARSLRTRFSKSRLQFSRSTSYSNLSVLLTCVRDFLRCVISTSRRDTILTEMQKWKRATAWLVHWSGRSPCACQNQLIDRTWIADTSAGRARSRQLEEIYHCSDARC